jgi:hypothetical protein
MSEQYQDFFKVKDNQGFLKNIKTNNVMNTKQFEYMARKKKKIHEEKRKNEILALKNELHDIKEFMYKILNTPNNI